MPRAARHAALVASSRGGTSSTGFSSFGPRARSAGSVPARAAAAAREAKTSGAILSEGSPNAQSPRPQSPQDHRANAPLTA